MLALTEELTATLAANDRVSVGLAIDIVRVDETSFISPRSASRPTSTAQPTTRPRGSR
jgi:hypothetical protein